MQGGKKQKPHMRASYLPVVKHNE
jgi:hypothetical protein